MIKKITLLAMALILLLGSVSQGSFGLRKWRLDVVDADLGDIVSSGNFTITVYNAGVTTAGTIYSDEYMTSKTNPVTPGSDAVSAVGRLSFYCAYSTIDVKITSSVYGGTYKYLSLGPTAHRIVYPTRTYMGFEVIGAAGEDITFTNTGGSIVFTSTEADANAVEINAVGDGAGIDIRIDSMIYVLCDDVDNGDSGIHVRATGTTGTAQSAMAGKFWAITAGTPSASIGSLDGTAYALSGTMAHHLYGVKAKIYEAGADMTSSNVYALYVESQVDSTNSPANHYMMRFNTTVGGSYDTPDAWFWASNPESVAYTINATHTGASTDKTGAIKINVSGQDLYLYCYSHAGQ